MINNKKFFNSVPNLNIYIYIIIIKYYLYYYFNNKYVYFIFEIRIIMENKKWL